jgi:hypothetical protein
MKKQLTDVRGAESIPRRMLYSRQIGEPDNSTCDVSSSIQPPLLLFATGLVKVCAVFSIIGIQSLAHGSIYTALGVDYGIMATRASVTFW